MERACQCLIAALLTALSLSAQARSLGGVVTDPSGAVVPGALVQLRGPGGERRTQADASGQYRFSSLPGGRYEFRVMAKGFAPHEERSVEIAASATLDVRLSVQAEYLVVNVEEEAARVNTDPVQNAGALVLGQTELEALSDDPEEFARQLRALAGPGGKILIDGFSRGKLPPKASIREVRINSNPFSAEYDSPGTDRIEIFTQPASSRFSGQAFFIFNNQSLNTRSPLLAQSSLPPYEQKSFAVNFQGPIRKAKASFGLDLDHRAASEDAFVLATRLDNNFDPVSVNETVPRTQTQTSVSPRLDYSLTPGNTLMVRFQHSALEFGKQGVGDFDLASRAYNQTTGDNLLQAAETAVLSPRAVNESRFQYGHTRRAVAVENPQPALIVQGAFNGGGAQVGNSKTRTVGWEFSNITRYTRRSHSVALGLRARQELLSDTSMSNFGGTYTFFGGDGPELDANGQPVAGTSIGLTALERYRRTLALQAFGFSPAEIRALGGGASQFSLNAGAPATSVRQFDIGLFWNDDWRLASNLTLSYGLRYEAQTNLGDLADWAPRFGVAWAIGGRGGKPAKTVVRAGFGVFYDRQADTIILQALRYNGVMQQSYLILNPDFFPLAPAPPVLSSTRQPQQFHLLDTGLVAPRTYQASVSLSRQFNRYFRLSADYISSRGVHLERSRNINAPFDGVFPYSDPQIRLLTGSDGSSRTNQLLINPNLNYKKFLLFGYYELAHGMSDAEGLPANLYNLRAEWGPSSLSDVRQHAVIGLGIPLPWKVRLFPLLTASSGLPYNITTGQDNNGDGFASDRPGVVSGLDAVQCKGGSLRYVAPFGCLDQSPIIGESILGRNAGRGPVTANLDLRLTRNWAFGRKGETSARRGGSSRSGKYRLELSASAKNVLNHSNWAAPSGDLSSPFFGQYRSLALSGGSAYNRRLDLQLGFSF
jgi:carboxypeptidase family protein